MFHTIYRSAVANRDDMVTHIRGPHVEQIIQKARQNWIEYEPVREDVVTAGIDSSFNSAKFQGIELWAVTAVSIKADGDVLADMPSTGIGSGVDLSGKSTEAEIEACKESVDAVDLVLMDGSPQSQSIRQPSLNPKLVSIMKKHDNVLFVSKTSTTKNQFKDLGQVAGDIFYYNHVTKGPGFSKLFVENRYDQNNVVTSTFVRLSDSTPIIKVEFLGEDHTESEIRQVLNKLYKNSVGGYPYSLKLAHNSCKISKRHMIKMVSLLGLSNEIGSREVLE